VASGCHGNYMPYHAVTPVQRPGLFQVAQRSSYPGWPFLVAGTGPEIIDHDLALSSYFFFQTDPSFGIDERFFLVFCIGKNKSQTSVFFIVNSMEVKNCVSLLVAHS
jgi:hypothetical protein